MIFRFLIMSKRRPTKELTHDNWDQDDDSDPNEENSSSSSTGMCKAPMEELAKRKIAVPKRRMDTATSTPAVFAGFSGFGKPVASSSIDSPAISSLTSSQPLSTSTPICSTGFTTIGKSSSIRVNGSSQNENVINVVNKTDSSNAKNENVINVINKSNKDSSNAKKQCTAIDVDEQFRADLRSLNEATLGWCSKHFEENPFIDLVKAFLVDRLTLQSPVFNDYGKYLTELDEKYVNAASSSESSLPPKVDVAIPISPYATSISPSPSPYATSTSPVTVKDKIPISSVQQTVPIQNPKNHSEMPGSGPSIFNSTSAQPSLFNKTSTISVTSSSFVSFSTADGNETFNKTASTFSWGSNEKKSSSSPAPFNFSTTMATATTTAPFSFGNTGSSIFSGGKSGLFSFGQQPSIIPSQSISTMAENTNGQEGEEEEDGKPYEPPKAEIIDQAEKDAFYSIRCKLFYMKEKKYEDRGLGVLSLKKKDDKARIQLIVRAATAVGSVLLNIMLTTEVKPIKTGTNNVQFVCYPNPPLPGVEGPTTILIRVKTSDDADELLEKMTQ